MPVSNLSRDDQKTILNEFCKVCSQVWIDRQLFQSAYENGDKQLEMFHSVAQFFFHDVYIVLIQHLYLQFSKLTDPAKTGKKSNLTTNFILEEFAWPSAIRQQLSEINDRMMVFRRIIEVARSKRIAHIDLDVQIAQTENLGAFPKGADWQFLKDLQAFVDIAYKHVFDGATFIIRPGAGADTHRLVLALEKATAYEACLKCSEGDRAKAILDRRQSKP
jgi:hypothetical protein